MYVASGFTTVQKERETDHPSGAGGGMPVDTFCVPCACILKCMELRISGFVFRLEKSFSF